MGHSVIQVPVAALESLLQGSVTVPVCPHVTLLGPFVDRRDVDDRLVSKIREILAPIEAFDVELAQVGHFDDGLTYLAPVPAEPFIHLTELFVAAFPQWPPYGGAFEEIVPHLSIGKGLPDAELAMLRELLPITAIIDEVTLTWWADDTAEILVRFPLRA